MEKSHCIAPNELPLASRSPHPIRILYAEDDPVIADILQRAMGSQGWEVVIAGDGRKAVQAWENGGFDLILMDLNMPHLDGLEAARLIRRQEKGGRIPILALTAGGRQRQDECLTAGMDGFLTKPIRLGVLIEAVKRHLDGSRSSPPAGVTSCGRNIPT